MSTRRSKAALILAGSVALAGHAAIAAPRLAVVVVVDQLRAVDVDQLEPLFGPGGFGGVARRGAHATLQYSYATTETGPGHATLLTGANPPVHGICLNRWWRDDRFVYAVEDAASPVLGAAEGAPGRGPRELLVGTLGDAMKAESGGAARVIAVAGKDRSAILSAGHGADLALWYDSELGAFTSSRAYVDELPGWAKELGGVLLEESLSRGKWSPLAVPSGHAELIPADDGLGEQDRLGGTRFPHDVSALTDEKKRREHYRGSPQAIDDLLAMALAAVDDTELGDDGVPDLLVVGISAPDFTGHWFGPGSLEATDLLRRLDLSLRGFIVELDRRFGRDGYVLAVTGDHGSPPTPERVAAAGVPAGRVVVAELVAEIERAIAAALPPSVAKKPRVRTFHPPHLYLSLDDLSREQRELALSAAKQRIAAEPLLRGTFRLDEPDPPGDPFIGRLRQASCGERSGQLLVLAKPRVVFDFGDKGGTDHGTLYAYDARVPLLLMGPGVKRGRFAEVGDPRDVAPTVAFLLRGPPPDAAEGRPLHFLLETRSTVLGDR